MRYRMRRIILLASAIGLLPLFAQQPPKMHWGVSYSHKDTRTSLILSDIRFADAIHGVALGRLAKPGRPIGYDQTKPVALTTADGGASWNLVRLKSHARSVFVLGADNCWVTAVDGLWKSNDGGKSFKKISGRRLGQVHFLDSQHGFAVGSDGRRSNLVPSETFPPETFAGPAPPWTSPVERQVTGPGSAPRVRMAEVSVPTQQLLETRDGGATWKEHPASRRLSEAATRSIDFEGMRGTAVGVVTQRGSGPGRQALPFPTLTVITETEDGGDTWTISYPTLPGDIRVYQQAAGGGGYALVWPVGKDRASAIYRIEAGQNGITCVFTIPDLVGTDLTVLGDGSVWLATVAEPPYGTPREVRMLYSASGKAFTDIAIESGVTANNVAMTAAPGGTMWAATDTGMILKLNQDSREGAP